MTVAHVAELFNLNKSSIFDRIRKRKFKNITKNKSGVIDIPVQSVIEYCDEYMKNITREMIISFIESKKSSLLRGSDFNRMLVIRQSCAREMIKRGDYPRHTRDKIGRLYIDERDLHEYIAEKILVVKSKIQCKKQIHLSHAESYALRVYISQLKSAIKRSRI